MTLFAGCDQVWNGKLEGRLLNPNQYRAQISAIDGVLFQNGPLKWSDRQNLEQQLLVLADFADDDPNNPIALEESLDLRLLSTMAATGKVSTPVVNSELTREWRRIRSGLFTNAAWFRHAAPDTVVPATPAPKQPLQTQAVHAKLR